MIFIGMLRERFGLWENLDALERLRWDLTKHKIPHAVMGQKAVNIFKGRRILANKALEFEDMTHLLFLDSDETFVPETARHLYNLNLAVSTGIVYQKTPPHLPCIYKRIPDSEFNYAMGAELKEWFDKNNVSIINKPHILDMQARESIWEIDECGTGCMMVQRRVLEAIEPPRFTGMGNIGTDIAFCRRVRAAGFPIYADLRVQLGHLVLHPVTQADFRKTSEWVYVEGEVEDE